MSATSPAKCAVRVAQDTPEMTTIPTFFAEGKFIDISVGPKLKQYQVHKALITAKSPYMAKALQDCHNDKTEHVYLNDQAPTAFEVFIHWLYRGSIPAHLFGENLSMLLGTCVLAEKLMVTEFKNKMIDELIAHDTRKGMYCVLEDLFWFEDFAAARSTKLYGLALRAAVFEFMSKPEAYALEQDVLNSISHCPSIVRDVLRTIIEWNMEPWEIYTDQQRCRYHDHADGISCD